jgi:hypothetical protein
MPIREHLDRTKNPKLHRTRGPSTAGRAIKARLKVLDADPTAAEVVQIVKSLVFVVEDEPIDGASVSATAA